MAILALCLIALFFIWYIRNALIHRKYFAAIRFLPGYRHVFSPMNPVSFFLPGIPYITPPKNLVFGRKHADFAKFGSDVISRVYAFPKTNVEIYIADADVIKEITAARVKFPKPVHLYRTLTLYGPNIVASEGDDWKRTRKIAAPAFSERNNRLVWEETVHVIENLFDQVWKDKDIISIDHFAKITLQITLSVIAKAGFGKRITWGDTAEAPDSESHHHKMTFKRTLEVMSSDIIFKIIFPERVLSLTARMRAVRDAFHELGAYMLEMITEHKHKDIASGHDLLSSLVDANNREDSGGLTDSELMGNVFVFLFAGQETTAYSLAFAVALLALHQDEQEKLYDHIKSVVPEGRMPNYDDMSKMTYAMAVFYEALRMFPPVVTIPKHTEEYTWLSTQNHKGELVNVPIPEHALLVIHTPGLHYNPRYWKDPHEFRPSRFLDHWPRDAFLPFSVGARACIGRKFAETEAIAVLSCLLLRYKVTVTEESQFAGETFEQRKARVLAVDKKISLTPVRLPLTFTRRG